MRARKLRGLRDDGFNFHCQVGVTFSVRRMRKEGDKGRKQKRADKDSSELAGQEVEEDGKVGDRVAMATVCSLSSTVFACSQLPQCRGESRHAGRATSPVSSRVEDEGNKGELDWLIQTPGRRM